jgi:hypothetical protein
MFVFGKLDVLVLDLKKLQCCLILFWNASENGLNFKNEPNFKNGLNSKNKLNFKNGLNI